MKCSPADAVLLLFEVTLHVRVWIEITTRRHRFYVSMVTLHVRVWIEIAITDILGYEEISHPPREGVD